MGNVLDKFLEKCPSCGQKIHFCKVDQMLIAECCGIELRISVESKKK